MRVPYLHFIRNSKSRPLFPFPMTWCLLCVFFFYFVPSLLISMFFVSSIWVRCFAADSTEVLFCLAPKRKRRNLSACVFCFYSLLDAVRCMFARRERKRASISVRNVCKREKTQTQPFISCMNYLWLVCNAVCSLLCCCCCFCCCWLCFFCRHSLAMRPFFGECFPSKHLYLFEWWTCDSSMSVELTGGSFTVSIFVSTTRSIYIYSLSSTNLTRIIFSFRYSIVVWFVVIL